MHNTSNKSTMVQLELPTHLVDVGGDLEDRVRGSHQLVESVSALALPAQAHLSSNDNSLYR